MLLFGHILDGALEKFEPAYSHLEEKVLLTSYEELHEALRAQISTSKIRQQCLESAGPELPEPTVNKAAGPEGSCLAAGV